VSGVVLSLVGIRDPRARPLMGFLGSARPLPAGQAPFPHDVQQQHLRGHVQMNLTTQGTRCS
jgi:hypothetical protein